MGLCGIVMTTICLFVVFRLVIVFPVFLRVTALITPVVYENFSHRRQTNHATMYVKMTKKKTEFNLQSNMKYVVRSVRLNLKIRKLTLWVPLVEQELSTLSVHMRSSAAFSKVHLFNL